MGTFLSEALLVSASISVCGRSGGLADCQTIEANESQFLINAVTVEVKSPKNQMSGFATNQDLATLSKLVFVDW